MNFATYLKSIMEEHELKAASVHEVSKDIDEKGRGLAPAHISMFLSGKRYPSASSILLLASSLSELTEKPRETFILGILSHIEMDFSKGVGR